MATSSAFTANTITPFTTVNAPSSKLILKKPTTIKCMSVPQDNNSNDATKSTKPSSATPTPPSASSTPPPPPPPRGPKVSTKFSDVLAFSGPAPERINGRLAMIGFVSALAVELSSGQDVLTQISNGGLTVFVGTSVVLTLASLVPLFKGVSVQSKSSGLMTSDAEMWNGRAAMLGLVALAFTEYVTGSALV
ncbi:early light-induced protein 1, chloroplastic-like [Rutidosis leptorrhynchoides]|uniref:early light-induced protein 1, chloroplastic-like n=1 Tax=Rutidosis leptorrhynchoides TaxID=125765 RepID=UPI003A99292D